MAMTRDEREYIEYRPQLGFKVNVRLMMEDLGLSEETVYDAPEELLEATKNLASDVFDNANQASAKIDGLLNRLENTLANDTTGPVPFAVYQNNPTPEEKEAFDNFHSKDVDGKLEGELYPLLENAKADIQRATDFLNDVLYGGNADLEDVDGIRAKEANEIAALVRNNIQDPEQTPLVELKAKTEMVELTADTISVVDAFADSVSELLDKSTSELLGGQLDSVISNLSDAPSLALQGVQTLSTITFSQNAESTDAAKEVLERMAGEDVQELLYEETKKLRQMKLDMQATLDWLDSVDTNLDMSPVTQLVFNSINGVEDILDAYEDVLLDGLKLNRLKELQYEDLMPALETKEASRQTTKLVGAMQEDYDFDANDKSKQVSRFMQNTGVQNKRL